MEVDGRGGKVEGNRGRIGKEERKKGRGMGREEWERGKIDG